MGFKDQVAADAGVFLNVQEFAEDMLISVAGEAPVTVPAVLDEDSSDKQALSFPDGTVVYTSKLYLAQADIPFRPKAGKEISVNGVSYRVLDTALEAGMLVLTLEKVSS
jgi:hypothetical protein